MPTYAPDVDVIRSARRTRTSSARLVEGRIQVRIPAWLSEEQERETVEKLVAKVRKRTTPRRLSDAQLAERAERLNPHASRRPRMPRKHPMGQQPKLSLGVLHTQHRSHSYL